MAKKDHFLRQLEKSMHVKKAPSHVSGPSEKTLEQLEEETRRLKWEAAKEEINYWSERRQANTDDISFGLASNNKRRFAFPRKSRRSWK